MEQSPNESQEKAAKYREIKKQAGEESPAAEEKSARTKSLNEWNSLVSQRIEEAIQQGAFDNLPGHGKPQDLRRNPHVPEEKEMAFHLLENNDMAPPWIMDRKALLHDIEKWRTKLRRAVHQHRDQMAGADAETRQQWQWAWRQRQAEWRAELDALNQRIETLNLAQPPIPRLEMFKMRLEDELRRASE